MLCVMAAYTPIHRHSLNKRRMPNGSIGYSSDAQRVLAKQIDRKPFELETKRTSFSTQNSSLDPHNAFDELHASQVLLDMNREA